MRRQNLFDDDYSEAFLKFWAVYPWKSKKGDAWKAFQQVRGERVIDAILTALSWQIHQPRWLKDGGDYISLPASYLRARCWEDEPFHAPPDLRPNTRRDTIGLANAKALADYERRVEPQRPTRPRLTDGK